MIRLASLAAFGMAVLSSCAPAPPPSRQARLDQTKLAECRHRADAVYAQQNRRTIFLDDDQRDTPNSTTYVSGITTRGLATENSIDDGMAQCVRDTGPGAADTSPVPLSPPPPITPLSRH